MKTSELKDHLYKEFLKESKCQLVSVYKQQVIMSKDCNNWGGCWARLPKGISYQDIEEMVDENNNTLT